MAAEESQLQNQQLCQQVESLEKKCLALLEEVKLECEERLREYKESPELKDEIKRACEVHLQDYKDSSEFKTEVAEACKRRLVEYQASDEMKTTIWNKGFRMFVSGFNRGLREARLAPSTPLSKLRVAKVDSDGEDVLYGEDDLPLPKGTSRTAAGSSEAEPEPGNEDAGPQGQEIVPYVGTGGSEQGDARPPTDSNVNNDNVNKDSIDDDAPRHVSPLRTVFPSVE